MGAKVRVILLVCTFLCARVVRLSPHASSKIVTALFAGLTYTQTALARKIAFFPQHSSNKFACRCARSFENTLDLAAAFFLLYGNSSLRINLLQIHFGAPAAP
jgi:hypothetical protein